MWRGLNFFSPKRRALRDSAFRIRITKLREEKQRKRVQALESVKPKYDVTGSDESVLRYSNEESVRKNPRLRRMIVRPTAELPRRHYLFIKNGTVPLSLEDLSKPGRSIFDESRIGEILKEKSKESDSWIVKKSPKKGIKVIEWKPQTSSNPTVDNSDVDLSTVKMLGRASSGDSSLEKLSESGKSLISILRQKAIVYSQTGINPDLMSSVQTALERFPGIERQKRYEELVGCNHTVESLIQSNLASIENFNLLIRSLGVKKQPNEAFSVVDSMIKLGYDPDQDTFVSLIMAAHSDADLARSAYLRMRQLLIPPNEKVYGALIKAHVESGDLASSFSLLRKMEDECGIPPTSPVIYTTLLDGLVKADKLDVAWDRFRSWRTWRDVKPDSVMFSVMIRACRKNQECERALGLLDDLRASGEFPTDITYSHLIECMATRSDFANRAFDFHSQMQLEGFELNSIVAKSLVKACSKIGDIHKLRKTIKDIANANIPLTSGIYADCIRTISTHISLHAKSDGEKAANLRLAWYIVADLKGKGVKITSSILNALTDTYTQAGLVNEAVGMLAQFESFQVAPNTRTYEILLEQFAKVNDIGRFFALYDQQQSLSDKMYHLALDLAIESRSSKRTVSVLEHMLARNIRPLPKAAERLAVVGRQIVQIHQVVGRMVAQQRDDTHEQTQKDHSLLNLELEEHKTRIAFLEGKTDAQFETPQTEANRLYWDKQERRKRPKLVKKDYLEVKKKGGRMHALKVDKPRPNLLVSS